MNTKLIFSMLLMLAVHYTFAQCGTFITLSGTPGMMETVDLSSFGVSSDERFELELVVGGGQGANALMGPFFEAFGTKGTTITASFEVPASGNLVYITGEAGATSSDGMFGGGGGGSAVWYDPDGISNNGDEVLLIAGAGGAGAHSSANALNPTTTSLVDAEANTPPTSAAVAASGQMPTSVGGAGGGGVGFDGSDAILGTVEGGSAATFAGISQGGVGALGANGGAGFGGGGGGGQAQADSDMSDNVGDFEAGGGGGGYIGGSGGAYDDARVQPGASGEDRIFRATGAGSYVNGNPTAGVRTTGTRDLNGGGSSDRTPLDGTVTISCSAVVPVELVDFKANWISNQTVALAWTTASEIENMGFEVQRSADAIHWKTISFVKGNGTTIETQRYKFLDEKPFTELTYYRLKQIDFSEAYEFSEVIVAQAIGKEDNIVLFPNPVSEVLKYELPEDFSGNSHSVHILDWSGKSVWSAQGITQLSNTINIEYLASGVYNLVVSTERWRNTSTFIKE
ncbi:MAG: T9SS type A sorting domain-containing protein [Bacteroidota bacterium]